MKTTAQIALFLECAKEYVKENGLIFQPRKASLEFLRRTGMAQWEITDLVMSLTPEDCFDGPEPDRDEKYAGWTVAEFSPKTRHGALSWSPLFENIHLDRREVLQMPFDKTAHGKVSNAEESFNTFCPECNAGVEADLIEVEETVTVKDDEFEVLQTHAICPICGEAIGDSRIEGPNLDRAYDEYRRRNGIISRDRIARLVNAIGLSQREMSRFLGFGEQTFACYVRGSIPSRAHSEIMAMAASPEGAKMLLDSNAGELRPDSIRHIESFIQRHWKTVVPNAQSHPYQKKKPIAGLKARTTTTLDATRGVSSHA